MSDIRSDMAHSCRYCSFKSADKIIFVKHLFQSHNAEDNFRYPCRISSCSRVFGAGDSFDAFRSHCARYHPNWKERVIVHDEDVIAYMDTHETNEDSPMFHADDYGESLREGCCVNELIESIESNPTNPKNDFVMCAASFILNLKEKFKLTGLPRFCD